jgi:isoquinoline 1-oxidoreductase beta subunit
VSGVESGARRRFLSSSLAAGVWTLASGLLPLGAALAADAAPKPPAKAPSPFDLWLRIAPDGLVTAYTTVTTLGQGTHTAIAQLVAEELDVALENVRVLHAPVEQAFHQRFPPGITTFASAGFISMRRALAPACAAARSMLIDAASARWGVGAASCRADQGQVIHPDGVRKLAYGELLAAAALLTPPEKPILKDIKDWRVLGKSAPRGDIGARVDGSAVFGIDARVPGMLVASVTHAPTFGGLLVSVDEKPALAVRGVRQVVKLANAVAVVADGYWPALKALRLLAPVWKAGPHGAFDTERMRKALFEATTAGKGMVFPFGPPNEPRQDSAATQAAIDRAPTLIDTSYDVPFVAHAPMEPMSATVSIQGDRVELWLSTQSQTDTQRAVAKVLGVAVEQVTLHTMDVGGGFGRRLEHDVAIEAALIAKAVGKPVKTIWSRETDLRSGFYRPITANRVRLALDANHMPMAMRGDMAGPSLLEYTGVTNGPAVEGFDWTYTMGWMGTFYAIPKMDTRWSRVDHGVPCTYWRSVGNSQNCFFLEHTIDQAARAAGADPLAYRRRLLAGNARALGFIDALGERAGWSAPLKPGHFRGFGLNQTNATLGGHVVEIEVRAPGSFRLVKLTAAIDAGVAINPRMVEAQMMGGTLFGLSAALFGEITFKDGQVEQGNFDGYRVLTLADTPPLDVLVISSGSRASGVGEEGPPSVMAALANALYAASGKPVTRLPVTRSGWSLAS